MRKRRGFSGDPVFSFGYFAMRLFLLLTFCLCLWGGCAQTPKPGLATLEKAYASQPGNARAWAQAGHFAWLSVDEPGKAKAFFEKALEKQNDEPWALYGLLVMAYNEVDHPRQVNLALQLLERQGAHPLAEAAAQSLARVQGVSPSLDAHIFKRLLPLKLQGEAAVLQADILADIAYRRGDFESARRFVELGGKPHVWSFIGPLFPSRLLSFAQTLDMETTGDLRKLPGNVSGPVRLRTLHTPQGLGHIPHEGNAGEVYVLAADVEIQQSGLYALRTLWNENLLLFVNQQQVLDAVHFPTLKPRLQTAVVHLEAGWHRLMLRSPSMRPSSSPDFRLLQLGGTATPPHPPPRFRAAKGPPPRPPVDLKARLLFPAEVLFEKLRQEVGEGLAAFVVAQTYAAQDANQARRFLQFWPENVASSPLHLLRAEIEAADAQILDSTARGKVSLELENARRKNPQLLRAILLSLRLALSENLPVVAKQLLQETQKRFGHLPAEFEFENARLSLELGLDAEALRIAERLSNSGEGLCNASLLFHQLAMKARAAEHIQSSLEAFSLCPGAEEMRMAFSRVRGDWEKFSSILERLQKEDESRSALFLEEHVRVLMAQRRFEDALKYLQALEAQWPYKASIHYFLADIFEALDKPQQALLARQQALRLMPYDLALQRLVQRALTGKELLEEFAVSTQDALKAYAESERAEASDAAYVLDTSVMRFFEDGSMIERTHIIEKAFSQRGVTRVAEVEIPPGAILLKLRTLKADGSILEPEYIEHKSSVSMPAVEPGDMVELEYLNSQPSRSLLYPGFSSPAFFYKIPFKPNHWARFSVLAPKTFKVQVDAHMMQTPSPKLQGDEFVFMHEEKNLPAFEVDPLSPPAQMEWLPFVSVGANPGYEGFITAAADRSLELGQVSFEVEQFARKTTAGKQGIAAVEALYKAVHTQVVDGNNAQVSAAATVGNERGSRFWLLYSALKSLGMDVRVVAATTVFSNPNPMLFPVPGNLGYWCLRVKLKGHPVLWLDTSTRFLPFATLPEYADGHMAYVMPEPGKPFEQVRLPTPAAPSLRSFTFHLQLDAQGNLSGKGEESYVGFMAAKLTENFGKLSEEEQQFRVQDSVSEQFAGASVDNIEIVPVKAPGEAFVVRYQLEAKGFASALGENPWTLPALTPLQNLGQRYATSGFRRTALFIPASENVQVRLKLSLPERFEVAEPVAAQQVLSQWGSYVRHETSNKNVFMLEESFQLKPGRISPKDYERFVGFAGEVDLFQAREFIVRKPCGSSCNF